MVELRDLDPGVDCNGSLVICLELRNCCCFTGTMLRVFTFGILSEVPDEFWLMSLVDEHATTML